MTIRSGSYERKTKETDIKVLLTLASSAESHIDSGVPFFDHMLSAFSKHGIEQRSPLADLETTNFRRRLVLTL